MFSVAEYTVIGSEFILSLYPILIKLVSANLPTQVFSRLITFVGAATTMASKGDWASTWGSAGAAGRSLGLGAITLAHIFVSYIAFSSLSAGVAMSLFYTYPMWNLLGAKAFFGEKYTSQELRLCSARHLRNIPGEHERGHRRHSWARPKQIRGTRGRGRRPRRRPHRIRHVLRRTHERAAESVEFDPGDVRGGTRLHRPSHLGRPSQDTIHSVRLDKDCPVQPRCRLHRLQSPLLQYTKSKYGDLRPSFIHRCIFVVPIRLSLPRGKAGSHESSWGGANCSCGESQ